MYWLTNHAVRRTPPGEREKQDISWAGPRPSKSHLIMFKCKLERIQYHASINYLELLDTKQFDGNKIDYSCNLSLCSIRLNFMQWKCMQKHLVWFSSPSETYQILGMRVGNFYLDSKHFFQDHSPKEFIDVHCHVLKNIQDCRSSMNAGRPIAIGCTGKSYNETRYSRTG